MKLWLVLALAFGMAFPAVAQIGKLDNKQPVEITSDNLEVFQPKREAVFQGNVVAKQGNVTLYSDKMIVHYREKGDRSGEMGAVSEIEAMGGVRMVTPQETASGARGVYNVDKNMIWLLENVVLTRGENVLKGSKLEYSFATGKSLVTSEPGKSNDRVKAVFVPEKKSDGNSASGQ